MKTRELTLREKQAILMLKEKSFLSFPVAQLVEHGANNAKIMGSIPRESKSWNCNLNAM